MYWVHNTFIHVCTENNRAHYILTTLWRHTCVRTVLANHCDMTPEIPGTVGTYSKCETTMYKSSRTHTRWRISQRVVTTSIGATRKGKQTGNEQSLNERAHAAYDVTFSLDSLLLQSLSLLLLSDRPLDLRERLLKPAQRQRVMTSPTPWQSSLGLAYKYVAYRSVMTVWKCIQQWSQDTMCTNAQLF